MGRKKSVLPIRSLTFSISYFLSLNVKSIPVKLGGGRDDCSDKDTRDSTLRSQGVLGGGAHQVTGGDRSRGADYINPINIHTRG